MSVYAKLNIVQQELIAPKNQYNNFGKYSYRSCEDIFEGLKPCLKKVKAIVTVTDSIECIGERYYIKATASFIDAETGERIDNTAYARESFEKKGMDESQITGATSSYARKYALNGLFCIDDVKDADSRDNRQEEAKAQANDEKKTKAVEKQLIPQAKATALNNKALADRVELSLIYEKCNVKSLSEITEKQFAWILANWTAEFVDAK